MKRAIVAFGLAALYACTDSTPPITPDQADEALATTITAISVDPNAETSGGHAPSDKPAPPTCTFDATTKWLTCTSTQNGLTIKREIQYLDAKGVALSKPDTTVASMKAKTTVTGTTTIKTPTGGTGTTTVSRNSEETVTGLAKSSKERVVNGTASGTEDSKVTDTRGTMTMKRTYADTTKGLTFPAPTTSTGTTGGTGAAPTPNFPTAGTIIRNSKATGKLGDGAEKTYTLREERTFKDGKVTIKTTVNGVTRTCVMTLGSKDKPTCTEG